MASVGHPLEVLDIAMSSALRLLPVNALIALLTPHDVWPPVLADCGFVLEGLEVPVKSTNGRIILDLLARHSETNVLLGVEAKSGANLDEEQARRLHSINALDVVRTGAVTLPTGVAPRLEVAYVCMEEHVNRILEGLRKVGWDPPVLAIGSTQVKLVAGDFVDSELRAAFAASLVVPGPPATYVQFDTESSAADLHDAVAAEMVARASHGARVFSIPSLAEAVIPQYPYYHRGAQQKLRKRVLEAARMVAADDAETFRVLPRTGTRADDLVEIKRSPEQLELQGRTQSYQAIRRRVSHSEHSEPPPEDQPVLVDEGPTSEDGNGSQGA